MLKFTRNHAHNTARRRRLGNAVLDAALVLPVLLSLTFGTVEYGYYFFLKHSMQGAVREGCRVGILSTATNAQVTQAVAASLFAAGLNSSSTTLDAKYTCTTSPASVSGQSAGTTITVTLNTTWGQAGVRALPTYLGGIGTGKSISTATSMRKEG
jgi:Flp pilus assembly protein TadG